MSLWDDLPADVRNSGALDPLEGPLSAIEPSGPDEVTDEDGTWSVRSVQVDIAELVGLQVDPRTGQVRTSGGSTGRDSTPIEFVDADASVTASVGKRLSGPGGDPDGGWRFDLDVPGIRIVVPALRGAKLDEQGQLRFDPANPKVKFTLPRLVVRTQQLAGGVVRTKLKSATVTGDPVDDVYSFIWMTPGHALIGPGDSVGFAFRTAVLDLSSEAGPSGVPDGARVQPDEWQGLYLPEVRLFVAPSGLEGIAVSAGVRDLWIGFGEHAGVTGSFSAEVVNRGGAPEILARFITPDGRHIAAVANAIVEVPDQSVFLVDARGGIAPLTTQITVSGTDHERDRMVVVVPADGIVTLSVTVTDGGGNSSSAEFRAQRPVAGPHGPPSLAGAEASIVQQTPEAGRIVIVSDAGTAVRVRLDPPAEAVWNWNGTSDTADEVTVDVSAGESHTVTARPVEAGSISLVCHFSFDHPTPREWESGAWWRNRANTFSGPDGTGEPFWDIAAARRDDIGNVSLTVDGYASFERHDQEGHNEALSQRRLDTVVAILTELDYTVAQGTAHGHAPARDGDPTHGMPAPAPAPGDGRWRMARAHASVAVARPVRAVVSRAGIPALGERDPTPTVLESGRPDCFRRLGLEVELIRGTFVRCEIWGEFDIQTAVENSLDAGEQDRLGPEEADRNRGDGICSFRVRLRIATDRSSWEVYGEFRAHETDLDGLFERRRDQPGVDSGALDVLGALAVMGPLAAEAATLTPAAGTLVQLGSMTLGASERVQTQVLTLRGADLTVSDGIIAPDGSTDTDTGTQVSVMLDVEVRFTFDLDIIRVPEDRPISVRYQAVGIRSAWDTGTAPEYVPIPVFDPNRGYELDIQPGSLVAKEPLDDILRILGVRVSRDNPTYLEVEAGVGVDLGPVTVDTIRLRADLTSNEPPQLTKLRASLDIPGTVHGSGSISLTGDGFAAAFDLTIVPLDIRAAAQLAVKTRDGVTGILIGAEVEFPVPIVLGGSGLGIFGLLGGVGINYARRERPSAAVPALDWLMEQLGERQGVMDPEGWDHQAGSYAVAAGLLVGTLEGGYVLHLKGIILLELPGPRLLLIMKADVLKTPPAAKSTDQAAFLAVLDIDIGRGSFTIGVVASYRIETILEIRVPVTAYFETENPQDWLVDLGTYEDRVTVTVLGALRGSGYLMVRGNGVDIPGAGLPRVASGLAIATGFHLQAVLMGSKAARLYVEVAAGFDAILGFDPFYLAGSVYIRGELMLFIVSIGVHAKLTLVVGKQGEEDHPYVHGEVCGKISFFFFSVSACLTLEIGTRPDPQPEPRPLVAGVTLVSRQAALLEGSGGEQTEGSALGEAAAADGPQVDEPVVPIDAIPVVLFHNAPVADDLEFSGSEPADPPGVSGPGAWRWIGDRWWAYKIISVTLVGPLTSGPTPSTWWSQSRPGAGGDAPALALLTWLPTPFSSAITYGETLRKTIEHRWGSVCRPAAPPQRQLWTFVAEPLGPRDNGWLLDPVVWPDPPGTLRTSPAARRLQVTEPWRTGDTRVDLLQGSAAARVVGDLVGCPGDFSTPPPDDPMRTWAEDNGPTQPTAFAGEQDLSLVEASRLLAAGGTLNDLAARWQESAEHLELWHADLCEGRILRGPQHTSDEPAPLGTGEDRELISTAWDALGHELDALADALHLTPGEPVDSLAALLLVPAQASRPLFASVRNDHGDELHRVLIDSDSWVQPGNPLSPRWLDRDGPFAAPVELAGRMAARIITTDRALMLALLQLDGLAPEATTVVIGWDRYDDDETRWHSDPFYLVAVDALLAAEVTRHDFDTTVVNNERDVLEQALTQDPTEHALLRPGRQYTVEVTWCWDSEEGDTGPNRNPNFGAVEREVTQGFTFRTAGADKHPQDLTPWLLSTTPGMGESAVLCAEPLRVALAHQNVTRLFAAYGRRLEVTVLSASGDHPHPPGGGAPGAPLVVPLDPLDAVLGLVNRREQGMVLTPWHETAGELVQRLPCLDIDEVRSEFEEWTLSYDLEPLTDYLLDIHSVPANGAGEKVRVYRCNFTTSRFNDVDHLASWIVPASVQHRLVRDRGALDALPDAPTGAEWDDAVQAAGLPVPQIPVAPRVEVWWAQPVTGPANPIAVVVECSEPLVRERLMPTMVTGPADGTDPTRHWWVARPQRWLHLEQWTPSMPWRPPPGWSADAPAAAVVATLARAPVVGPGSTRVMCLLAPNSRGRRLVLELVRAADELAELSEARVVAVDVTMGAAPWEVGE